MKGYRYLANVATLQLDADICIACRRCVEVCPHQVFVIEAGKARIVDRDLCMECGACARNCPPAALKVNAGVGCASGMINEWLQDRGWKKAGDGCC